MTSLTLYYDVTTLYYGVTHPPTMTSLIPPTTTRVSKGMSTEKVPNAFHHPKQWAHFQHLVDQPKCSCGAGKGLTFLFDEKGTLLFLYLIVTS